MNISNPLERPAPSDPLPRVHDFARDLAYGVSTGLWNPPFGVSARMNNKWIWSVQTISSEHPDAFDHFLSEKWQSDPPSQYLLNLFGYLDLRRDDGKGDRSYNLTEKAINLLSKPSTEPEVFISYRRVESSAFALLIEARLRLAGNPNPFIDKNIPGGEDWHGMLKARIQSATYFIILVGPTTLESDWVQKEIAWAIEADCKIMTLCHNGKTFASCPPELTSKQGYEIKGESALEYEAAANFILNSLGYATY